MAVSDIPTMYSVMTRLIERGMSCSICFMDVDVSTVTTMSSRAIPWHAPDQGQNEGFLRDYRFILLRSGFQVQLFEIRKAETSI